MYSNIPKQFEVDDKRTSKELKKKTFNGYKKNQVLSEMQKNILSGNIEKSILWTTELHCSGYTLNIYDKLLNIYIKEINKSNIILINVFLDDLLLLEKKKSYYKDIIFLRNDQHIRNHINNIVSLLSFSTKYKLPKLPNIASEDFNMKNNKGKILSENLNDIQQFIKRDDNKNLIIPLSEIFLNLNIKGISKSLENCLFWLSWMYTYEKTFHKGYIQCNTRKIDGVDNKYLNDFTWIIWNIILFLSDNIYIQNLYKLYKLNFTKSKKRQKIDLIIFAFIIIIDPYPKINFNKLLIDEEKNKIRIKILANINYQYLDTLKNNSPEILQKKLENIPSIKKNTSPIFSNVNFKQDPNTISYINQFSNDRININTKSSKLKAKKQKYNNVKNLNQYYKINSPKSKTSNKSNKSNKSSLKICLEDYSFAINKKCSKIKTKPKTKTKNIFSLKTTKENLNKYFN